MYFLTVLTSYDSKIVDSMDQISIKTTNPEGRLVLKIDLQCDLAAGVYLSEAPFPLLHTV